jgi:hypothetical protein
MKTQHVYAKIAAALWVTFLQQEIPTSEPAELKMLTVTLKDQMLTVDVKTRRETDPTQSDYTFTYPVGETSRREVVIQLLSQILEELDDVPQDLLDRNFVLTVKVSPQEISDIDLTHTEPGSDD